MSERNIRLTGVALGVVYGLFCRFAFGFGLDDEVFLVMTLSFIFGVPVGLGYVAVWFSNKAEKKKNWVGWVTIPWVASMGLMAGALALAWEGLICIFLWIPLVTLLSAIGGIVAGLAGRMLKRDSSKTYCMVGVALLPFAAAPIEALQERSQEIRTVHSQIRINASPEAVWSQIKSVPLIREEEHGFEIIHLLGFPRPLEARLEGEGVGALRYATFERGVLFFERITEWELHKRISFSIDPDTENIPPDTFDEHVIVGGPYFDVLHGTYEIEKVSDKEVVLHLYSDQRLSTGFNFYSHLWTEWLMDRLQSYILDIVKTRSENSGSRA